MRGGTVRSILGELLGKRTGISKGKGGSMHMFAERFFGGNGIVGAQVPVGVGLGFAQKYLKTGGVCLAMYGDGAANQGQVFEAYNLASIWKLPVIFICENNKYAMGTSVERSTLDSEFYKRGGVIPGLRVNAMDVLAVRQALKFGQRYCLKHGPLVMEFETYRYQGHSMSDPGTSYRTREEISAVRKDRDPPKLLARQLAQVGIDPLQLKSIDDRVKQLVDDEAELAINDPIPSVQSDLYTNIY